MKIIQHGRMRIEFDAREIVRDNPGEGTPEMVYVGKASATLTCAQCEGVLMSARGDVVLTDAEVRFLNGALVESERDAFWAANP